MTFTTILYMIRAVMKKKAPPKPKNIAARSLENPLFRQRKIPSAKAYDRKKEKSDVRNDVRS